MAAYQSQFVVSVIHDNHLLREVNKNGRRTCIIPFDSEYKLRLKNQKNKRCKIGISIDGTDVLFGKQLVLYPEQTLDLERFLTDNDSGNKFKFMSIKKAIDKSLAQDPSNPDNGHIRVTVYEEIDYYATTTYTPVYTPIYNPPNHFYIYDPNWRYNTITCNSVGTAVGSTTLGTSSSSDTTAFANYVQPGAYSTTTCNTTATCSCNLDTKGVTVEGDLSNQKFHEDFSFSVLPIPITLDIWLEGYDKNTVKEEVDTTMKDILIKYVKPALREGSNKVQRVAALKWIDAILA